MRRLWWLALLPFTCYCVTEYGDTGLFSGVAAKNHERENLSRSFGNHRSNDGSPRDGAPTKIAQVIKSEPEQNKKDLHAIGKQQNAAVSLSAPNLPPAAVDKAVPITVKVVEIEPVKTDAEIIEELEKAELSKKVAPSLARDINRLAQKQAMQGDFKAAEQLLGRLANVCRDPQVNDQRNLGLALNNLGMLFCKRHKYGKAEPLLQGSLLIQQQALGPESPAFAEGINNLATLYYEQLRFKDAEPLYMRAMQILKKSSNDYRPQLARTMNNLAGCYSHTKRLKEAEKMLDEVLDIDHQILRGEHPDLAATLNNLGYVYVMQHKYTKAQPLLQKAMQIAERSYGPNSVDLVSYLDNYSYLLAQTDQVAEGRKLKTRANKILERNGL
jgi:tetratricopeptide (TPR) repeat protein